MTTQWWQIGAFQGPSLPLEMKSSIQLQVLTRYFIVLSFWEDHDGIVSTSLVIKFQCPLTYKVAVVGALQSMMALSTEAAFLADKKRPHDSVELLCNRHRIYIFPILCPTAGQNAFLVATCRRSLPPTYYHPKLQEAAVLTEQSWLFVIFH